MYRLLIQPERLTGPARRQPLAVIRLTYRFALQGLEHFLIFVSMTGD